MSEWLKETGCKPVGYAYAGSNPAPPTRSWASSPGLRRSGWQRSERLVGFGLGSPEAEPVARVRGRTAASRTPPRRARSRATLPPRAQLAQLVEHFHGKEGVVGSSPTLGFSGKPRLERGSPVPMVGRPQRRDVSVTYLGFVGRWERPRSPRWLDIPGEPAARIRGHFDSFRAPLPHAGRAARRP